MRSFDRGSILGALFVVVVLAAIGYGIYALFSFETNHHDVTFKVNKSERVVGASGKGAKYMVYTDKGVFQDTDSFLNLKFNSADVYNQLEAGHTYACDVVGYRVEFLSWFENIVRCNEVK